MSNWKQNFLNELKTNPKRFFLIDAFGALLTAISLFGILAQLEPYFGMPKKTLYLLSGIAFCLFIYSISCNKFIKLNCIPYLRILIISNIIYSLISLGLLIKYSEKITELGWVYFILELLIIGIIVIAEYKLYLNQVRKLNTKI
ncbi:hypothetical protein BTO14_16765 [Polaribacter butkevichii]|uniref:Uncharacterized protein n=1 Tax=Polaribacter butkevichii TaxID=218490 RepID=A0A2P6C9N2_9FLAO|nr:hypothetical protein BTO14_16765 [Polaribacter butkevichii]